MEEGQKNRLNTADEISLIEIFSFMWSKKIFVLKVTAVFIVLGVVVTLISPDEYTAEVVLLPESGGASGVSDAIGALAGFAGIFGNMPSSTGAGGIGPALYPGIVQSTPFLLPLMQEKFYFSRLGKEVTLEEFFTNHIEKRFSPLSYLRQIPRLPYTIIGWFQRSNSNNNSSDQGGQETADDILKLTGGQSAVAADIASRINISSEDGTITITTKMQDPRVAAQLARYTQQALTKYVTDHRVSKEKRNLKFVEQRTEEARKNFIAAQEQLARFRDRNQNVATAIVESEEERLLSEYNLRFDLYNTLVQQQEKAKIAVQEVTPIFDVLEPVKIPLSKSEPNGEKNFFISVVLGVFFGFMIVFVRKFYHEFIKGQATS